ncbi:hypothetical protein HDV05_000057 [Chytridiales sp. JEL 0842]|nr:hypothetical protein HDV05_000057 [Chytridiales sp. JEL 0842]
MTTSNNKTTLAMSSNLSSDILSSSATLSTSPFDEGYGSLPTKPGEEQGILSTSASNAFLSKPSPIRKMGAVPRSVLRDTPSQESFGHALLDSANEDGKYKSGEKTSYNNASRSGSEGDLIQQASFETVSVESDREDDAGGDRIGETYSQKKNNSKGWGSNGAAKEVVAFDRTASIGSYNNHASASDREESDEEVPVKSYPLRRASEFTRDEPGYKSEYSIPPAPKRAAPPIPKSTSLNFSDRDTPQPSPLVNRKASSSGSSTGGKVSAGGLKRWKPVHDLASINDRSEDEEDDEQNMSGWDEYRTASIGDEDDVEDRGHVTQDDEYTSESEADGYSTSSYSSRSSYRNTNRNTDNASSKSLKSMNSSSPSVPTSEKTFSSYLSSSASHFARLNLGSAAANKSTLDLPSSDSTDSLQRRWSNEASAAQPSSSVSGGGRPMSSPNYLGRPGSPSFARSSKKPTFGNLSSVQEMQIEDAVPAQISKPSSSLASSSKSAASPTAPPAAKTSRFKLPLPPLLKKLAYGEEKPTQVSQIPHAPTVRAPQPPKPVATKKSLMSKSSPPLLRRLMGVGSHGAKASDKDKPKPEVLPPTSVPLKLKASKSLSAVASKPSGANNFKSEENVASLGTAVAGSSKTLAASSATVWDSEEHARNADAEANDSDNEAKSAAKARFEAKYKVQKQLGSGGHSTVRLAIRAVDNMPVVCKFIRQSTVWNWYIDPVTKRKYPLEIHLMRQLALEAEENPEEGNKFIKYFEHFELNGRFVIVMEYLGDGWVDLYDYIELYGPVKEDIALSIFKDVVKTVQYLHKVGYYHNDIKDENILIHVKTRQIKLIDFGSATYIDPNDPDKTSTLFYGTKKFAAPEAVRNEPYIPDCQEAWALGTLLFVLLFKLDPFTTDEEILTTDIGRRIVRFKAAAARQSTVSRGDSGGLQISEPVVNLLKCLMEREPSARMRVREILRTPVFR